MFLNNQQSHRVSILHICICVLNGKMSLVLRPSRSSSTNTPPTQQLTDALKGFETVLSDSERQKLHSQTSLPDADAVLIFTAELDVLNSKRNKRSISRPLFSFLECTRDFSTVVSTFVSSNPTIAALVWGSVQFAMIVRLLSTILFHVQLIFSRFLRILLRTAELQLRIFSTSSAVFAQGLQSTKDSIQPRKH